MSLAAILTEVMLHPTRYVVVTGGEPMVAKEIHTFLHQLRDAGKHITIETAGTVQPPALPIDLASLSPKLANSVPSLEKAGAAWLARHQETRLQPAILRQWLEHSRDYQLKFVISSEADLFEAQEVIRSIGIPIPPEKILLMPEGTSLEAMRTRYDLLVKACLTHGYRLSPRLHIELFGNTRGT